MQQALDEGMILKDATPYNVQWRGAAPVFIDVGSFERLSEGEPWFGYRQFCMQFLYPLMLQSYREVPFRPLLRGQLEGIAPEQMRNLLSLRDRFAAACSPTSSCTPGSSAAMRSAARPTPARSSSAPGSSPS